MERTYLGGKRVEQLSLDTSVAAIFYQLPRWSPVLGSSGAETRFKKETVFITP